MQNKPVNNILLLITAFIWGSTFVAQRAGMEFIGPFSFNAVRSFLGAFSLLFLIIIFKIKKGPNRKMNKWAERRYFIGAGILLGIALFFAIGVQQVGMVYTTASKAGFISSMYIVLVPLISLFLGRKIPKIVWLGVILGVFGLYFLCAKNSLNGLGYGDLMVLASALLFAIHILIIDYFAPKVDSVKLSCVQFFVCGIISLFPMFLFENPDISAFLNCKWELLYAGVISSGVAYTLQIIGQKDTDPAIASLILSLESVFAAVCGFLILGETLTLRELFGCFLMFAAILSAQIKPGNEIKKTSFEQENS